MKQVLERNYDQKGGIFEIERAVQKEVDVWRNGIKIVCVQKFTDEKGTVQEKVI